MDFESTLEQAKQEVLYCQMFDQAKVSFSEHLASERSCRGRYWENAVCLMVVHLTTASLESFINAMLHLAEYWQQPRNAPVTADEVAELVDARKEATRKWKWLARRASGGTWFDRAREPLASYVRLVDLRNDLADHDKAPILRESRGWTHERRRNLVEASLTHQTAARAIRTVAEMVWSLRAAFEAGDRCSPLLAYGRSVLWGWAEVREPEILRLAAVASGETPAL